MPYFRPSQVIEAAARQAEVSLGSLTESVAKNQLIREQRDLSPPDFSRSPIVTFDIFLSHSSLDAKLVLGIYALLTRRNYSVYLDSICDPQLSRTNVTRQTGRTLRYRMAQCRSLFVCTTTNITQAKWVPWELGFSDGWKDGKAAILPITDDVDFGGKEFFEIYPEVRDRGSSYSKPSDLEIWDQNRNLGTWGAWVSSGRIW